MAQQERSTIHQAKWPTTDRLVASIIQPGNLHFTSPQDPHITQTENLPITHRQSLFIIQQEKRLIPVPMDNSMMNVEGEEADQAKHWSSGIRD